MNNDSFDQWNRLKELRSIAELTQMELAYKSNLCMTTILQIEAGNDAATSGDTKRKLALFFGCKIGDIFPVEMIGNITKKAYLEQKIKEDMACHEKA